jgi:glycosyltransferase involved in cell wall biosynthesis
MPVNHHTQETNQAPTVSIGMPAYNCARFIRDAIDSLLGQTFADFELIISDNASTDSTEVICREYAKHDPRVKYIRQNVNRGASANFRFVLEEATGKYFMWAAADDYWSSNWLETLIRDFISGTALAFGHVTSVDERGNVLERFNYRRFSKIPFVCWVQYFLREEFYFKANYIYGLYIREALLEFTFGETYGADNHFVFKVIQQGRLSTNPGATFFKRAVASSEAGLAKEASSGLIRKLLLIDLFPYYAIYPFIARSLLLRIAILVLLPPKYFKSLCFMIYRHGSAKLRKARE